MATVQEEILNVFYQKLAKSGSIDQSTIEALRKALTSTKKLKADEIVAILASSATSARP